MERTCSTLYILVNRSALDSLWLFSLIISTTVRIQVGKKSASSRLGRNTHFPEYHRNRTNLFFTYPQHSPIWLCSLLVDPGQPRQIETRFLDHSTAELTWKHSLTGGNPSSYRMFAFYEGDYVEEQQQQHRRHRSVELNATLLNISQVRTNIIIVCVFRCERD